MTPGRGYMDGAPRGRGSEGEGRAAAAASTGHRRGGIRWCGAPAHANLDPGRMAGGMSSAVIGGFCEHSPVVHELVAKFADMTAKETAKDLEGARVAAQRGHDIPEARPHTPAAGHRQGHGATSTKTKSRACPTWTPAPSRHARFATCRRRTCARWGECGEQRKMEWALSRPEAWRCV
jgi:hypothetical protein